MEDRASIVYRLGDALYINLTNRCTNACSFCIRKGSEGMEDYKLWLKEEPEAQEVIDLIGDPREYSEIVFCGFGEPTIKLEELKEIARYVKDSGGRTRINTNGHANLYHKRDVVPELEGIIDSVSISLNASNAEDYHRICNSRYGLRAFDGMLDFARASVGRIPEVVLSIVDLLDEEDIEKCRNIAKDIGARLRIREFEG